MLEKPTLADETIIARLQGAYGLKVGRLTFLPLGVDVNAAVYRADAPDGASYFVKLRRGLFHETAVTLPRFLSSQGIEQIISPLTTQTGELSAYLEEYKLILYPFIEGRNGYEVDMTADHWAQFGAALRRLHTAALPSALLEGIRRERYAPDGRERVRLFLARAGAGGFTDPVLVELAALLQARRAEILSLVERAERLARTLEERALEFVVCHSDVHAGNILIAEDGALYIVDWDDPIRAPKERDLMFPGGGQGFGGHMLQEEEILFYKGYGRTEVDPFALAYYRYERIIQDIAEFCEQLFSTEGEGEDRPQALRYLKSNFAPGGTIDVAYRSDKTGWSR